MQLFCYGPAELKECDVRNPGELAQFLGHQPVTWLNVDGVGHAGTIEQLGRALGLHPLALEDVVHVHQRAKVEDYEGVLFIVARMVRLVAEGPPGDDAAAEGHPRLETEQLSLFLGPNFVVTFQEEGDVDCLEPVRERLRKNHGKLRQAGADHLAYAILDAVTDGYFPVLEWYSDALDDVEDNLDTNYDPQELKRIHEIRTDLLTLRRLAWPLREALQNLQRDTHAGVTPETRIYLRDCYDHTVQILDVLETYREICADLREFYFSTLSQRTNDIVKVLTVISTIFIPLSFVAGVWGMNFDRRSPWNMPELGWWYGYPFALAVMLLIVAVLMCYFWRKGWLRR
jgi:magnesium transporter